MFEAVNFDESENITAFGPIGIDSISPAIIKVIGVGGGGGNAVEHMSRLAEQESIKGVEFYDVNTDAQVLRKRTTRQTVQIGANITKGLGAGADPKVGRAAAEEDRDALVNMISGADMTFIAAGMGGGTGTGAAPVVAQISKEQGALTVAVVTKPFKFEAPKRMRIAEQGIQELSKYVDSLIIIPNDNLRLLNKNGSSKITAIAALSAANSVLSNCVLGITNMITSAGGVTGNDINVDFADVRTVMSDKGHAMIGIGLAEGEGRAERAMQEALTSPLLEYVDISGAEGMLISINAGPDLSLDEMYSMMGLVEGYATEDATVVFGCSYYPEMEGKVGVTLVATGIGDKLSENKAEPKQSVGNITIDQNQHTTANTGFLGGNQMPPQTGFQPQQPVFGNNNVINEQQVQQQQPQQVVQQQPAAPQQPNFMGGSSVPPAFMGWGKK